MAGREVKERLAQDVALWQADGVISSATAEVLRQRYDLPGFGLSTLLRYLGIAGGVLAAFGILGLIAAMAQSLVFGGLMLGAIAAGLCFGGLEMARDPLGRYPHSAKLVLTMAVLCMAGAAGLIASSTGLDGGQVAFFTGLLALPVTFFLAYRFQTIFLIILGLLGLFHWVGSWTSMMGRSSYAFDVQDPQLMVLAALVAIGVGVYHERHLQRQTLRFYQAYEAVGLVYFNLSMLILTLYPESSRLAYVILFTLAALAQLIIGSRLQNGLLTGFGVTACAIDLFTRYHEYFWSSLDLGAFLLFGGLLLFGFGVGLELVTRRGLLPAGERPS